MAASSETVVLITGANQGLGFECVKKLAAEQPNYHILLGSRSLEKGQQAAAAIDNFAKNTTVEALELDVDDDDSIAKAVKHVEQKYGRLDVLLNNAGIMSSPSASGFRADMTLVMQTNAISAACVTEAFLPLTKKSSSPRIVFMSSGWGSIMRCLDTSQAYYGYDAKPYFTSKAAMNMIGAQYAVQLGKEGFKVNIVSPDFRSTNLNGFHEYGGDPAGGALQACKMIVSTDKDGPNGTFTELDGVVPW
ncbi:hypothetical protein H2200_006604 [Cladophialophora chaetospira]|uniref:Uncharacterized protein n=1 Tax=Cladophialophora chaetospira TaxID=386627 RepID=A0AA39CHV9_9EURO|nr:hypothetical protein H2200_006604 [Cladophialophora chaetospira]